MTVEYEIDLSQPCVEWTGSRHRQGYGWTSSGQLAHRWAWEQERGPIPAALNVLHACDNPPCTNLAHLFLGTQADNVADMHAKGRAHKAKGVDNFRSVLSDAAVRRIRRDYAKRWVTLKVIAERYGVSPSCIGDITRGRTRRDAGGPIASPKRRGRLSS